MRYFALLCVPAVAFMATVMLQPAEAQVISALTAGSLVVAGLATLALAKEGIIASGISRGAAFEGSRWGKREAEHVVKVTSQNAAFGPFFEAIARADSADCGKLLVCQIMAKPEEKRTVDEKRVAALFEEDLEHIDASASYVNFQLAALVGTLKNPAYCSERYAKCPSSVRELQEVLHIYSGSSPQVDF